MNEIPELANYGALGVLVAILIIAVRVLYTRNVEQSRQVVEIVKQNTQAFHDLKSVIREKVRNI